MSLLIGLAILACVLLSYCFGYWSGSLENKPQLELELEPELEPMTKVFVNPYPVEDIGQENMRLFMMEESKARIGVVDCLDDDGTFWVKWSGLDESLHYGPEYIINIVLVRA